MFLFSPHGAITVRHIWCQFFLLTLRQWRCTLHLTELSCLMQTPPLALSFHRFLPSLEIFTSRLNVDTKSASLNKTKPNWNPYYHMPNYCFIQMKARSRKRNVLKFTFCLSGINKETNQNMHLKTLPKQSCSSNTNKTNDLNVHKGRYIMIKMSFVFHALYPK